MFYLTHVVFVIPFLIVPNFPLALWVHNSHALQSIWWLWCCTHDVNIAIKIVGHQLCGNIPYNYPHYPTFVVLKKSPLFPHFFIGGGYITFWTFFSNFFGTKIKIPVATSSFDSECRCIAVQGGSRHCFWKFCFFGPFLRRCLNPSPGVLYHIFFPPFLLFLIVLSGFPTLWQFLFLEPRNLHVWIYMVVLLGSPPKGGYNQWGYMIPLGQKFYVPTIFGAFLYTKQKL